MIYNIPYKYYNFKNDKADFEPIKVQVTASGNLCNQTKFDSSELIHMQVESKLSEFARANNLKPIIEPAKAKKRKNDDKSSSDSDYTDNESDSAVIINDKNDGGSLSFNSYFFTSIPNLKIHNLKSRKKILLNFYVNN